MTYVPFASAVIAPHILRYLQLEADARGHDLEPVLHRAGLTVDGLHSGRTWVSYRQGAGVIAETIRVLDDPLLGLAVGVRQHAASWGLLGLALMTAPDLRSGMLVGLRFQQAGGALVQWRIEEHANGDAALVVSMRDTSAAPALERFMVDEAFASVLAVARDAAGPAFAAQAIHLRHSAPNSADAVAAYRNALGVAPRFSASTNRLEFDAAQLALVPLRRDPWVHAEAVAILGSAEPVERERRELIDAIEVAVAQALPRVPALQEHAERLWISERTLRRRLASYDSTYEAIVDGVRATTACGLITDSDQPFGAIAHAVGFSDARTMRRAVVRWTGRPPSALREGGMNPRDRQGIV